MQGKTVLIVHSEELLASLLAQNLQDAGLRALQAPNLAQAAATFRYFEPDLVLAELQPLSRASPDARDLLMGGSTGRPIPVVALVTVGDDETALEGLGVSGVVRVPFKSVELIALIRQHLEPTPERGLSGDLGRLGVTDILTMFDMGKRSGRVDLDDGQRKAWLDFRSGEVVDGGFGTTSSGPEVIDELIDWQQGNFEVAFETPADGTPVDGIQTESGSSPDSGGAFGSPDATSVTDLTATNDFSIASDDRAFLKQLLDQPPRPSSPSVDVPAATIDSGSSLVSPPSVVGAPVESSPSDRSEPTEGGQAAHHALTLLNTVASYASGFAEKQLLQRRLEGVRQRLVKSHGGLSAFEVSPDASVGLRSHLDPITLNSRSIVEATAEWLIAFSLEIDRTFPGSMPRATLHILVESIGDGPENFGFMKALGFGGGDDPWS